MAKPTTLTSTTAPAAAPATAPATAPSTPKPAAPKGVRVEAVSNVPHTMAHPGSEDYGSRYDRGTAFETDAATAKLLVAQGHARGVKA